MPDGFVYFRCGAMVLSDLGNSPELIAEAAEKFGVSERVGYVVRLALAADDQHAYWQKLLPYFPSSNSQGDLPGLSRLVSETRLSGAGRGAVRVWLRTSYKR